MKKTDEIEVFEGEIIDISQEETKTISNNKTDIKKKENRIEKTGKLIDSIVFIGSTIFKLIFSISKSNQYNHYERSSGNNSSFNRKRKRRRLG